jgi:hypothetical protein
MHPTSSAVSKTVGLLILVVVVAVMVIGAGLYHVATSLRPYTTSIITIISTPVTITNTLTRVVTLTMTTVQTITQTTATETTVQRVYVKLIFEESFENYDTRSFPLKGDWTPLCFKKFSPPTHIVEKNGCLDSGIIIDSIYHSPTKSFRLWEGGAERLFKTDAKIIGFEVYVMIESVDVKSGRCTIGFVDEERTVYTGLEFSGTAGDIIGVSWWDHKYITKFVTDKWYKVRLVLDRSTDNFSVWIDDELKEKKIATKNSYRINGIELGATSGFRCYYDDLKVFEISD